MRSTGFLKQLTKCLFATVSLCFVMALSLTAQAAVYKPNQVYVDPTENTKGQYYSLLKKRMKTYSEDTIDIVYPKGAALSVKSSKKALKVEITKQRLEDPSTGGRKVYVQADPTNVEKTYWYYDNKGERHQAYEGYTPGTFYIELSGVKVNVTPNKIEQKAEEAYLYKQDDSSYYKDLYDDGDGKGWYYLDYNGRQYSNDLKVDQPGAVPAYEYSTATITLSATKAGTYTVTVKAGSTTKKVKVLVTANGGQFKSAKLGKQVISLSSRKGNDKKITETSVNNVKVSSSLKSAKFKITGDKGIKVTGMIVQYTDKNGKKKIQTVKKNGGKIKLSQDYSYKSSSWNGSENRTAKRETYVLVSYKDTFLGTYVKYSVVTKHGYREIKRTQKDRSGKVRVSYMSQGGNYTFWTY